jgi:PAS domain S-box-containing protein
MGYRILVVEDDAATALGLRDVLRRLGHDVTGMVATGSDAVREAESGKPDIILMDISLSGPTNGIDAATSIHQSLGIPVLFITAHSDPATLLRAHEAEPYGFILKPFARNDLRVAIEVAFHKHRADTRLRESERHLSTTLQAIGQAVISTNQQGEVAFVNPAAEALMGIPSRVAFGKPVTSLLTLLDPESRTPLNIDRDWTGEAILSDGTGREVTVMGSIAAISSDEGETLSRSGQVIALREVNEARRADPERSRPVEPVFRVSEEERRHLLSFEGKPRARIFLVQDHPITRHGLEQLIGSQADMDVCGCAGDTTAALHGIDDTEPDLVIADLSLNGSDGLELVKGIRSTKAHPSVLILSTFDESVYAQRALRAGARGYIMKAEPPERLLSAMRRILSGGIYLSENESVRALENLTGATPPAASNPVEQLSDRELEVFRRIGQGTSLREIAATLHISVKTVETHCAHIKSKLNIGNSRELVRQAALWMQLSDR